MLVKRKDLNDIFEIYKNVFDKNIVVALENYKFFILKNNIIKQLTLDEVVIFLKREYSDVYNEYQRLFELDKKQEKELVVESASKEATSTSNKKEKNETRNS